MRYYATITEVVYQRSSCIVEADDLDQAREKAEAGEVESEFHDAHKNEVTDRFVGWCHSIQTPEISL